MSKKTFITATLFLVCTIAANLKPASAQDAAAAKPPAEPGSAYRLDFSVNEIDDGKKINSRQYSMNLSDGDQNEVKIGTRVPVEPKNGEFQYIDVGTNIWCRLRGRRDVSWLGNDVLINVRSEISNFAVPDPQAQSTRPIIRQLKIDASTIAVIGKSMVVGSVDDPNSKRQFQLEVMVTKLH